MRWPDKPQTWVRFPSTGTPPWQKAPPAILGDTQTLGGTEDHDVERVVGKIKKAHKPTKPSRPGGWVSTAERGGSDCCAGPVFAIMNLLYSSSDWRYEWKHGRR